MLGTQPDRRHDLLRRTPAASSRAHEALQLLERIGHAARMRECTAEALELIHSGDQHFDRTVAEIDRAKTEVLLEMYQMHPDEVGRRVARALIGAHRRGVSVRVLLDGFGSSKARGLMAQLRTAGIEAHWYCPWRPWHDPNRRTHRKLVVIDGQQASIGGFNLIEPFSERCHGARAWRDLGLWVTGPVAGALRQQLAAAWQRETGEHPMSLRRIAGDGSRCFIAGGTSGRTGHAEAYAAMIDSARSEVLLANPYFLPDATFRARMVAAVERGVRVAVVLPRVNDLPSIKHLSRRLYPGLLGRGIEIWERRDRMVHAKAAVIDRSVAAIGSVNINRRSLHHNSETLLLTAETDIVREVQQFILAEGLVSAERLSHNRWANHPDRRRWAEALSLSLGLLF
jgi:cardiolipin synthase